MRFVIGVLLALTIWGWLDVRTRGRTNPEDYRTHKTDFTVYTEAGAAFFDGREPYQVTNPRGWSYLYPPLFAIFVAPLSSLDSSDQVTIWFFGSLLACWGCYRELVRIGRNVLPAQRPEGDFGRISTWLGYVAVSAATLPALNCLQRGQVGILKLYLLLVGFRLLIAQRGLLKPLVGGSLLALSITLKITPLVPAGIAVAQQLLAAFSARSRSAWQTATAGSLGISLGLVLWLLIVPGALVGWTANLNHLDTWWATVAARAEDTSEDDFAGNSTTLRNQSLANAAYRFGNWADYQFAGGPSDLGPEQRRKGGRGLLMDSLRMERVILALRLAACGLIVLVASRMAWSQDRLGQAAAFGMACAATLVVFTIARGHYYMMILPANVFAPLWLLKQGRTRLAISLAVTPLVLVLTHYIALDYAGRVGLLGLGTTLWYFISCGFMLAPKPARAAQLTSADPQPTKTSEQARAA